jgi:Type VI secretion system/phage-baseplate injector OB domain
MTPAGGPGGPHYGKYRGKVATNLDPLSLGRVQVGCPAVLGDGRLSWAMPSLPYAGPGVGLFLIPPVGADVWVEFEGGDPDYPIWAGCFWASPGDVPAQPAIAQTKLLKTDGLTLTVNDIPGAGGVTVEVSPPVVTTPLKISLTSSGIELSNGAASVKLSAVSVSVNNGALEVI